MPPMRDALQTEAPRAARCGDTGASTTGRNRSQRSGRSRAYSRKALLDVLVRHLRGGHRRLAPGTSASRERMQPSGRRSRTNGVQRRDMSGRGVPATRNSACAVGQQSTSAPRERCPDRPAHQRGSSWVASGYRSARSCRQTSLLASMLTRTVRARRRWTGTSASLTGAPSSWRRTGSSSPAGSPSSSRRDRSRSRSADGGRSARVSVASSLGRCPAATHGRRTRS
jgi:hypothetical protein